MLICLANSAEECLFKVTTLKPLLHHFSLNHKRCQTTNELYEWKAGFSFVADKFPTHEMKIKKLLVSVIPTAAVIIHEHKHYLFATNHIN